MVNKGKLVIYVERPNRSNAFCPVEPRRGTTLRKEIIGLLNRKELIRDHDVSLLFYWKEGEEPEELDSPLVLLKRVTREQALTVIRTGEYNGNSYGWVRNLVDLGSGS